MAPWIAGEDATCWPGSRRRRQPTATARPKQQAARSDVREGSRRAALSGLAGVEHGAWSMGALSMEHGTFWRHGRAKQLILARRSLADCLHCWLRVAFLLGAAGACLRSSRTRHCRQARSESAAAAALIASPSAAGCVPRSWLEFARDRACREDASSRRTCSRSHRA